MPALKALAPLLILLSATAHALEIRAYVQPPSARPNQIVNYVITVRDGEVQSIPALRFPLQVQQVGAVSTSRQFQIVNGQQSSSLHLSWPIMASEPGEFVIPPQDVVVNGGVAKTPEVKLAVTQGDDPAAGQAAANDAKQPILQLELGKKEIYQGELVPLTCTLFVPREMPLRRLGLIDIEKNDFAIARFPQQSEQSSTVIDGVGYLVLTFRSTLSALRSGDLQVGPAKMELLVEMPVAGQPQRQTLPPGFPQMFFGTPTEPRKLDVLSPPVRLNVLALPTEGKPANFSGAVGEFAMTASASPTELTVGDPVSVELVINGSGGFDALPTPRITAPSGWRLYPAKRYHIEGNVDQNLPPSIERKIGYTQVMVPEAVHTAVPPFEFSYFSPNQKQYVTVRSEAIPLNMRPAPPSEAPTTAPSGAASTAAPPPAPTAQPQATLTDIVVKPAAKARWVTQPVSLLIHNRGFWQAQAVPLALLALTVCVAAVRRRSAALRAGRAGELRAALTALEQHASDDAEFLRHAAQLIHRAHGARPVEDPELQAILHRYQSANFSSASGPNGLSADERRQIVGKLSSLTRHPALAPALASCVALLLGAAGMVAQEPAAPQARAATPDEVYRQAIDEVEKGNFTRAQYLAESLTKKEPPILSQQSFELIGHARFRQEDEGRAALWYQRARLLGAPSAELRQNLRFLSEKLGFITFPQGSPLVEWSYALHPNTWALLAAGGVWLALIALSVRVLAGTRFTAGAITLVVVGLLIALPAAGFAAIRVPGPERVKDIHVIVLPDTQAHAAATVASLSQIELPPGSQVRLLERRGAWAYVEAPSTPDPVRGWVEVPAMAPLWPWDPTLIP